MRAALIDVGPADRNSVTSDFKDPVMRSERGHARVVSCVVASAMKPRLRCVTRTAVVTYYGTLGQ
jgi:hypothetical protein